MQDKKLHLSENIDSLGCNMSTGSGQLVHTITTNTSSPNFSEVNGMQRTYTLLTASLGMCTSVSVLHGLK